MIPLKQETNQEITMADQKKIAKYFEDNFRRDFQQLLKKYGAEITIVDDDITRQSLGMKRIGPHNIVTIFATWDDNNDQITPFIEFTL